MSPAFLLTKLQIIQMHNHVYYHNTAEIDLVAIQFTCCSSTGYSKKHKPERSLHSNLHCRPVIFL